MAITKVKSGVRTLGTGEVVDANIATDTIRIDKISGSAAAGADTFLKKDGTWAAAGSTSASDLDSGTLANARLANPVDLSAQTGSMKFPVGTTAQRPTGATGMVRMNSTVGSPEWYSTETSSWHSFSSATWEPYNIDFLVIEGGGGAGTMGGGAGGYRSSYNSETSGGGGSSETALAVFSGSVLTITVGAGGQGWIWPSATHAADGNNSVFSTITSTAGGKGGENGPGGAGGSGGGGGTPVADGTANQGYAGGTATSNGYGSGAGGGAGALGGNYTGTVGGGGAAGDGGAGVASTITAGSVTRAGGGGGGVHAAYGQSGGGAGSGGAGAGGGGGGGGGAGTVNTGSGGGGGSLNAPGNAIGAGGSGGSGVVILRMLTADYTGTTTGSPSVATSGDDTILTYNSSGTYTS